MLAVTDSVAKSREICHHTDTNGNNLVPIKKLKTGPEADIDGHGSIQAELDAMKLGNMKHTTQHHQLSSTLSKVDCKSISTSAIKSEASDQKELDGNRAYVFKSGTDKSGTSPGCTSHYGQGCKGLEGAGKARKRPAGTKSGSEVADEPLKTNSATTCTARLYKNKDGISSEKSLTSTPNFSKFSSKNITSTSQSPTTDSTQKELSQTSTGNVNDNPSTEVVAGDQKFFRTRKVIKDSPRLSSVSNVAELKLSTSLDLKGTLSDSQDINPQSSRASLVPNVTAKPLSGESSSSLMEGASDVQHKVKGSSLPVKVEKSYQASNHITNRGNVAQTNAPDYSNDEQVWS